MGNEHLEQEQTQLLGFDMPKFERYTNDPQSKQQIKQDMQEGGKVGVGGV